MKRKREVLEGGERQRPRSRLHEMKPYLRHSTGCDCPALARVTDAASRACACAVQLQHLLAGAARLACRACVVAVRRAPSAGCQSRLGSAASQARANA